MACAELKLITAGEELIEPRCTLDHSASHPTPAYSGCPGILSYHIAAEAVSRMKTFPLDPWIQTTPTLNGDSKEGSAVSDTSMGQGNLIGTSMGLLIPVWDVLVGTSMGHGNYW